MKSEHGVSESWGKSRLSGNGLNFRFFKMSRRGVSDQGEIIPDRVHNWSLKMGIVL